MLIFRSPPTPGYLPRGTGRVAGVFATRQWPGHPTSHSYRPSLWSIPASAPILGETARAQQCLPRQTERVWWVITMMTFTHTDIYSNAMQKTRSVSRRHTHHHPRPGLSSSHDTSTVTSQPKGADDVEDDEEAASGHFGWLNSPFGTAAT
jgi:hypothetical protein